MEVLSDFSGFLVLIILQAVILWKLFRVFGNGEHGKALGWDKYARAEIAAGRKFISYVSLNEPGVMQLGEYKGLVNLAGIYFVRVQPPDKTGAKLFTITTALRHLEFLNTDAADAIRMGSKLEKPGGGNNIHSLGGQHQHPAQQRKRGR